MSLLKVVHNEPVKGLPDALVCGECGASSRGVLWQAYGDEEGLVVGMIGITNCKKCESGVVGILSNDPAWLVQLQLMAEEAFG